eukprot:3717720-Rhodomonas_salina.5
MRLIHCQQPPSRITTPCLSRAMRIETHPASSKARIAYRHVPRHVLSRCRALHSASAHAARHTT